MGTTTTDPLSTARDALAEAADALRTAAHARWLDADAAGRVDHDRPDADGNGLTREDALAYRALQTAATEVDNRRLRLIEAAAAMEADIEGYEAIVLGPVAGASGA